MCHAIVLFSKMNKVSYNLLYRVQEVAKNRSKKCIKKLNWENYIYGSNSMTQDFLQQREVWFPWNWWKIRNCREICFKICFDKKIAKRCCLFKALKIMHKTPCWQIRYHISLCAKTIYRFSKYIFLSKPLRNFACFEFYKLILKHFLSSIIKVHLVHVEEIDNILFQKRKEFWCKMCQRNSFKMNF